MPRPARLAPALLLLVAAYPVSQAIRGLVDLSRNPGVRVGFEMLGIEVGLLLVAVGLALALPGSPSGRLGLGRGRLPWSAVALLIVGTLGLSGAIDAILDLSRAAEGSKVVGMSRDLARTPDWTALAFTAFATALAPGICEELLCRGLVQRSLARWAGPLIAIPAAAIFFGILHQEWVHGSIAAALGLYLGLGACWADSTRPAIAAHTVNNAIALLGSVGLLRFAPSALASIPLGLALAAAGLAWAWHTRPPGDGDGSLQLATETADR